MRYAISNHIKALQSRFGERGRRRSKTIPARKVTLGGRNKIRPTVAER